MLFNSFVFIGAFLPLTLIAFWFAKQDGLRRGILLASSLFFYGYWYWPYLALLVGLVGVAWLAGLWAERTTSPLPVWCASISLLGILGYFKYAGFLAELVVDLGLADSDSKRVVQLALPIGISFIVFQALGYVVDVYRREFSAERRFSVMLLFKAFFPQLIAGPICRAHELIPQLKGRFVFSADRFFSGLAIFAVGLLLKEFFADGLAPMVDKLFAADRMSWTGIEAWTAALGFGAQIYADFWAYSTMAVGLARMFGVSIPVNFLLPYFSTSLREFWRRWHITLSQWLRDYLYKPLGGSRNGHFRTVFALMATMLLGGLWHGANYTFIAWGGLHGLVLVIEHMMRKSSPWKEGRLERFLGWAYVFVIVMVSWVFFRAQDISQATSIVQSMFHGKIGAFSTEVVPILALSGGLFVMQWPIERLLEQLRAERIGSSMALGVAFWGCVGAVVLGAPAAVPFIYFQF